ncbi:MAG TPA: hypothetical protein VIO61_10355 [Anaerolineaceae bacterium]
MTGAFGVIPRVQKFSVDRYIWLLACLIALVIRLIYLERLPLTDSEATLALQALRLARGEQVILSYEPAYLFLTTLINFLFSATNFSARIFPALAGTLLVFVPWFFKDLIGKRPAIILSFFLALDPGLIAISREANGTIFAITFLFLGIGFLRHGCIRLSGASLTLALLGGPGVWGGLLGIGIAWGISRLLAAAGVERLDQPLLIPNFKQFEWKKFLFGAGMVLIILGTGFLLVPRGINGLAGGLPGYFEGWSKAGEPVTRVLYAFLTSQLLMLVLMILGWIRGVRNPDVRSAFLTNWFLAALILVLLQPGRHMPDGGWAIIPLLTLAAIELDRWLSAPKSVVSSGLAQASLVLVLLIFVLLNFLYLVNIARIDLSTFLRFSQEEGGVFSANVDVTLRLVAVLGGLLLLVFTIFLVGWAWSMKAAGYGVVWGSLTLLVLLTLSNSWSSTGLIKNPQTILWHSSPYPAEIDLLEKTVRDFSEWNMTLPDFGLVLVNLNAPSVEWALRDMRGVKSSLALSPDARPAMFLSAENSEMTMASYYRGQDFTIRSEPAWSFLSFDEFIRWIFYREGSQRLQSAVLWVRLDLFPGESKNLSGILP